MNNEFILKYRVLIAIVAIGLRVTAALRTAGLSPSFIDLTKNDEDMNPRLINLSALCHVLLIYPSDLFHPNLDKANTKRVPHSPRPQLRDFSIIEEDYSKAFLDVLDKDKFVNAFRYDTYYCLTGMRTWKKRSPTILNAKNYLALMNMTLYEFFLHVEKIAWERIRKVKG